MDLDIRWDDQQPGVILMAYGQPENWDEVLKIFETQARMAAEVSHPVAVIVLRQEKFVLPGSDWMAVASQIRRSMPDNVRVWIAVGVNRMLQAVIDVARRAGIINVYAAPDIEAARELAAEAFAEYETDTSDQPEYT